MEEDQHEVNDVEHESLKPFSSPEVIFDQLNKLEEIAYDSKVSDAIYHLSKLRNVFSTARKDDTKGAIRQLIKACVLSRYTHMFLKTFTILSPAPFCDGVEKYPSLDVYQYTLPLLTDMEGHPPQQPPRDVRKTQEAADELITTMVNQFKLSSQMSAIDINLLSAMNKSVETFHAALQERVTALLTSIRNAQQYADATRPLADDMNALLQKVRRLEALIDRLDEYTAKQEAALMRQTSTQGKYRHTYPHM